MGKGKGADGSAQGRGRERPPQCRRVRAPHRRDGGEGGSCCRRHRRFVPHPVNAASVHVSPAPLPRSTSCRLAHVPPSLLPPRSHPAVVAATPRSMSRRHRPPLAPTRHRARRPPAAARPTPNGPRESI
uniref:Uncharacterized protein n=1 Tax=Oryza sativa subsp. japonica TaxID=39947 RepID=Q6EQG1_ORYSJ|nr:hypothetical protein [Oryza sativa Japonica Group]